MTPFMSAVSGRAYPAAITILETAQKIAKGNLFQVLKELFFNLDRLSSTYILFKPNFCVLKWYNWVETIYSFVHLCVCKIHVCTFSKYCVL